MANPELKLFHCNIIRYGDLYQFGVFGFFWFLTFYQEQSNWLFFFKSHIGVTPSNTNLVMHGYSLLFLMLVGLYPVNPNSGLHYTSVSCKHSFSLVLRKATEENQDTSKRNYLLKVF